MMKTGTEWAAACDLMNLKATTTKRQGTQTKTKLGYKYLMSQVVNVAVIYSATDHGES